MIRDYLAQQTISLSGDICGSSIELRMEVKYVVQPGEKQTLVDPGHEPFVEDIHIEFFDGKDKLTLPWSIHDRFSESKDFKAWLMTEAAASEEAYRDDAADHQRELMRENYL